MQSGGRRSTSYSLARCRVEIAPMTFREFVEVYKERHVVAKGLSLTRTVDWRIKPIVERFGDWALAEIKTADVEDFIADLRKPRVVGNRPGLRSLAPASINRTIEVLRHMLNWAVGREYIDKTPFRRGSETLIKKLLEDNQRRRRIGPDEEQRLLSASPPHLQSMIIAALDTGMRRGEMLALRFADIDLARGLITLRGETTKSKRTRLVPISTQRLRAVLEWLRIDAEGQKKSNETLVFSNEIGEPLPHFHNTWLRTILKAHGIKANWSANLKHKGLSPESKAAFHKINLRWHDLRHEYASRLVERGVPLAQVRDLLGHASITTTERYDNQKLENLQVAAAKLETGMTFDAPQPEVPSGASGPPSAEQTGRGKRSRPKPDAESGARELTLANEGRENRRRRSNKVSRIFQDRPSPEGLETSDSGPAIEPNELSDLNLGDWLGGRDSCPKRREPRSA